MGSKRPCAEVFQAKSTAEDGTGGESYIYRVDITGFNEQRVVTPSFAVILPGHHYYSNPKLWMKIASKRDC